MKASCPIRHEGIKNVLITQIDWFILMGEPSIMSTIIYSIIILSWNCQSDHKN